MVERLGVSHVQHSQSSTVVASPFQQVNPIRSFAAVDALGIALAHDFSVVSLPVGVGFVFAVGSSTSLVVEHVLSLELQGCTTLSFAVFTFACALAAFFPFILLFLLRGR